MSTIYSQTWFPFKRKQLQLCSDTRRYLPPSAWLTAAAFSRCTNVCSISGVLDAGMRFPNCYAFPSELSQNASFFMFLSARLQRIGMHQSFPRFLDSLLCICLILHGIFSSESLLNSSSPSLHILGQEVRLNSIYLIAGIYSYLSGLALAPYKVFYAMGVVGIISFALSILQVWTGAPRFGRRRHWHKR